MSAHKSVLLGVAAVLGIMQPTMVADDNRPTQPQPPTIAENHRAFLSRVARRSIRDALMGRAPYDISYVPQALQSVESQVVVRCWAGGFLVGAGIHGPAPICMATRNAALSVAAAIREVDANHVRLATELSIEIEAAGEVEPLPSGTNWAQEGQTNAWIEPGRHGLVVAGPDKTRTIFPSEIIRTDRTVGELLEDLAQSLHMGPEQVSQTPLLRFRTVHWYEPRSGAEIVSLHRGLTLISAENIKPEALKEAANGLAAYMRYRQLNTGLFTYQFDAGVDRYSDADNLVRQVGAVIALAAHARQTGDQASLAAADRAIQYHLQGLTPLPGHEDAAFIATADGENKLGVTALLSIALVEHPGGESNDETRRRLVQGMLSLQHDSGAFVTAFPPADRINSQDYYPGEALLALALAYQRQPSQPILDSFDRAIAFYREYFQTRSNPAFVPWQVQAFARMAVLTKRKDFSDFAFGLCDWLGGMQADGANCPWPEMKGGIAPFAPCRADITTALFVEGLAEGLLLARAVGDNERAERYQSMIRGAVRFVLQLQVRPEEAFFMRSPQDAVWGVRTTPSHNQLRIDHCHHALVALLKSRQVLFPDE